MRRSILFLGLLAAACAVPSAQASVVYQYVIGETAGQSGLVMGADGKSATLELASGSSYTVNVYLQETIDGVVNTTSYLQEQLGLKGAAFSVSRANGAFDGVATVGGNFGAELGPPQDFGGPTKFTSIKQMDKTATNRVSSVTEGVNGVLTTGVTGVKNGNIYKILLGTITFNANSTSNTYTLNSLNPTNGNTIFHTTGLGVDLNTAANSGGLGNPQYTGTRSNPFTIVQTTVTTAIPEPSSMILGSLAIIGGGFGYVRRRFGKGGDVAQAQA